MVANAAEHFAATQRAAAHRILRLVLRPCDVKNIIIRQ